MSTLTAFAFIPNRSEATPALWNRIFSQLSDNLRSVAEGPFSGSTDTLSFSTNLEVTGGGHFQFLSVGSTPPSYVTTALITMAARSDQSDYLYFTDSSGLRSNYVIGSRAGGTADGLNIWDASGATMIASFSKQSVRFYQQVVGPVFDLGGALTGTYNAATFGTASMSTESRIQAAIDQASIDGITRVYVPDSFLPYSASSVSFIYTVQMIREGGNASVDDVLAYGATGTPLSQTPTVSSTSAIQAAINTGRAVDFVGLAYRASNLSQSANDQVLFSSMGLARIIKNVNGSILSCRGDKVQFYQLEFRGDTSATPTLTGHNVEAYGNNFTMINCGSRWASGRAVKAVGSHTQILGTCDIYQTADATASGYDIEIGVSGTATLYHELIAIYTSQPTGGILLTDVGGAKVLGGQIGKLSIESGTLPAGVGVNAVVGVRVTGDATAELSSTLFSACAFSAVTVTFAGGTSGCIFDLSNAVSSGGTVINNGNADNIIITRGAVSGSVDFPGAIDLQNNKAFSLYSTGGGVGGSFSLSASDNLQLSNLVPNKALQISQAGATGIIQNVVNSVEVLRFGASQISSNQPVVVPTGTALLPSLAFTSENSLGWFRSGNSSMALSYGSLRLPIGCEFLIVGAGGTPMPLRLFENGGGHYLTTNMTPAFAQDNTAFASWRQFFNVNTGANDKIMWSHMSAAGVLQTKLSLTSTGDLWTGDGVANAPAYAFNSDGSLGWYRSAARNMALSLGTLNLSTNTAHLWASGISLGNTLAGGGTLIPAMSSMSSLVAAFVVQGSASSFTIVTWTSAQPGDQILTTVMQSGAVSSLSSGLVLHSHCTQAGQIEFRLSNVSTLAQNQSSRTYFFTRITPF